MKTINFLKRHQYTMMSIVLMVLAVMTGGAGVMMADAPILPDPANPVDPVDPNVNNMDSPDGNGAGQSLGGTQASATQLKEGELAQPDYDQDVVKFRAHKYVLLNQARTVAQQRTTKDYEITHFRVGEDKMSGVTKADIAAGAEVVFNSSNYTGDLKLMTPGTTLFVDNVSGYKDKSKTKKEGDLMLFVTETSKDGNTVTARALNGPAVTEGEYNDDLSDMTCPAIPSGTKIIVCALAGAESQQEAAPDNFQPRPKLVFLQKQIFNVVITNHYADMLKKAPWAISDIKASALSKFSKKAENTLWIGKQKRFKMLVDPTVGEEYVYTTEGIMRQLSNTFGCTDSGITYEELTNIMKIQFTGESEHDTATAFCGKNMLADIINMDMTRYKNIEYTQKETDYGVTVRSIKNNFGTLNIVYAPSLDDLGYKDSMIVVDMLGARYYTNIKKRENTVDMSKGAKDTREATRYIYIEAGALALRGFNSILVCPNSKIAAKNISDNANPVTVVSEMPENPYEGMVICLTDDITVTSGSTTKTYTADNLWIYKSGAWAVYTGTVNA